MSGIALSEICFRCLYKQVAYVIIVLLFFQFEVFCYTTDEILLSQIPAKLTIDTVHTGDTPSDTAHQVYFDPYFKERYRSKDFEYVRKSDTPSWIVKFKNWLLNLLEKIFGRKNGLDRGTLDILLDILMVLILLAAVIAVIRLLLGKDAFRLLFKREKLPGFQRADAGELSMDEKSLEDLIKQSVENNNYRLAIRYQYVLLLKNLSQKGWVDYHPEKTDREYLREIRSDRLKELMASIIYIYHRTWYGNHRVISQDYTVADQTFKQAFQILKHG